MGTHRGRALTIGSSIVRSFLVVVGMLGGIALQTGQAQAAPTVWSVTPSPNQDSTSNVLDGVSCSDPTWCVAVGQSYDVNVTPDQTLVESFNGTAWSITPSPDVGDSNSLDDSNDLNGVSCTDPTWCVAVGRYNNASLNYTQTLIETWDGSAWSITPSPNLGSSYNTLNAVSCTSPTDCVAVGYYTAPSGGTYRTLVESWDGTAWSTVPSPNEGNLKPKDYNELTGASCTSSIDCVAVGWHATRGRKTLIESWNGTAWSIMPSSAEARHAFRVLVGVSCTSATSCMAVGDQHVSTLAESWDGSAWSIIPSPDEGRRGNFLDGVSCISSTDCVAVGLYGVVQLTKEKTLIETWDGSAWSITPSPDQGSGDITNAVSCTDASDCVAVGYDGSPDTTLQTLVLTGSG